MPDGKDEDDKKTPGEILGLVYEYGLYALFGVAAGLLLNMLVKAYL